MQGEACGKEQKSHDEDLYLRCRCVQRVRRRAGDPPFQQRERRRVRGFQVGIRKYDSRAENNHRWVNLKVKAFGDLCERIKKMSLKEGSFISLCGDYDEERWTDKDTGEGRSAPVIVLDDIKFSHTGGQKKEQNGNGQDTGGQGQQGYSQAPGASQAAPAAPVQSGQTMQAPTEMPQNFTGYESFSGGQNPFFPG